jgi:uncharacterized protein (UPF0305 family)
MSIDIVHIERELVFQKGIEKGETEIIIRISDRLATAKTKGDLGSILADETGQYSLMDLQILGGMLYKEMMSIPRPYRDHLKPYMTDQLFGAHHRLLTMYRSGKFRSLNDPITDRETFDNFCKMIPDGCYSWDDQSKRTPFRYSPQHRLFYYLVSAFTMFVLDRPGHPVGMPFPGGAKVEERNGQFYCLIRDHEKEVTFSICNFCPAYQSK